jgi:hypothetical protein
MLAIIQIPLERYKPIRLNIKLRMQITAQKNPIKVTSKLKKGGSYTYVLLIAPSNPELALC